MTPFRSTMTFWLEAGMKPYLPSPRVGRYLILMAGLIIITAMCRCWVAAQVACVDAEFWSGPYDPSLHIYHPTTAWLWRHDPHGIALMAVGLAGIIALGPIWNPTAEVRTRAMVIWGTAVVILCSAYALLGIQLFLVPIVGLVSP